jgi:hypothetical protein
MMKIQENAKWIRTNKVIQVNIWSLTFGDLLMCLFSWISSSINNSNCSDISVW